MSQLGPQISLLQRQKEARSSHVKNETEGDTTVAGSLPVCGRQQFCTLKDFCFVAPTLEESVVAMRLWMLGDEISSTC